MHLWHSQHPTAAPLPSQQPIPPLTLAQPSVLLLLMLLIFLLLLLLLTLTVRPRQDPPCCRPRGGGLPGLQAPACRTACCCSCCCCTSSPPSPGSKEVFKHGLRTQGPNLLLLLLIIIIIFLCLPLAALLVRAVPQASNCGLPGRRMGREYRLNPSARTRLPAPTARAERW